MVKDINYKISNSHQYYILKIQKLPEEGNIELKIKQQRNKYSGGPKIGPPTWTKVLNPQGKAYSITLVFKTWEQSIIGSSSSLIICAPQAC